LQLLQLQILVKKISVKEDLILIKPT